MEMGQRQIWQTYLESSAISSWWIFCLSMNSEGRYFDIRFSTNTVLQYCLCTRYWSETDRELIFQRKRLLHWCLTVGIHLVPQTALLYRVDTWGCGLDTAPDTEDRRCDRTALSLAHRIVWMGDTQIHQDDKPRKNYTNIFITAFKNNW